MPVANTVPNSDRYDDFNTTTASAGPFPLTFAIWAGSLVEARGDIEVRVDGVPTTAFTVTGTLDTASVPHVILDPAVLLDVAAANAFIEVEGNGAARRIYQYGEGQGVPPRYQNAILNFCLAAVRDIRQKASRALRVPYGEAPLELPAAADRAEGFLYFDTDGEPRAVPSGNVDIIAGIADEIVIVAGIADDVQAVAAIDANVTTVAGVADEVVIVAGIAAQVVVVAGIDDEVEAVAAIDDEVVTVAGLSAYIPTLAGLAVEIVGLYAIRVAISTVATNIAAVLTAAANMAAIIVVAGIDAAVSTVAGIAAHVTSVAGNAANITAVAGNAANINTVAGAAADVTTVAGAVANVNTVATNIADVNTVAANIATIGAKLNKDGTEQLAVLRLPEAAAPGTPAAGEIAVYAKVDGKVYKKDDAGVETELGAGSGGASDYATRAAVEAATIDPAVDAIRTLGYHVPGRGGADHVRLEFDAGTLAIIAALPSAPPLAAQWAIYNARRRLDEAGVLSKLDILCDFGGVGIAGDIDAALVNWINPAVPLTSNGTLTYTANLGITGDGSTGYIGTGLGLDDLTQWSLNSACAGVWLTVNAAGYGFLNDDPVMGVTGRLYIRPNDSGKIQSVVNQSSNVRDGDVVGRLGHTVVNRSAAGAVQHYRDGEWVGDGTQASVDVSTSEIHFLRYNTDYAEDTIGWAHMGSSLTAAEVALIYEVMTEYRHILLYEADPGALLISDDGAMWELLPYAEGRNVLQYGAHGTNLLDDTQAFVDGTALRQKLHIPHPLWAYQVADEVAVRAHVTSEWAPIELTITTLNSRGFWLQDKSKLKCVDIRRTLSNGTAVHGDRHNAICIGQFHGDQRPYYDIECEARITDAGATRHNIVTVIGNVKGLDIALDVNGDDMESVFLSHWGSVQNPSSVVQTIQRPRECRLRRLIARNEELPGTYGMYLAGPVGWSIGQVELESFSRPVLISAGDLNQTYDAASNNETIGRLLANNEIESLKIIDPVLDAIWCQGASDDEGGTRFFGTDRAAATSLHIGSLTIIRGANTTDGIARFEHWKNITIDKFAILDEPGAASGVTDLLDPGIRIESCTNIKINGRARVRHPVYIVSGCDIDLDLVTENNRRADSSTSAIGIRMNGAIPTATVDGAVSAGATSIVLDSIPCHIYPGMAFEISSVRHFFNGSAYSGDTTVTIPIEAAPASIADNAVITILNGPSDIELRGAMRGHYIGLETISVDKRVPFGVRSYMDMKEMYFHGSEINEGERIDFLSGTFDHNNRGNSATGRDIRIDATGVGYKVQNCDFCPSPGSALVHYHITTTASASAVDVSHNRYFTAPQTARTTLQANGADGVANQNSNNYTKP